MKSRKEKPIIREQQATYEDYASLADEGQRYELADGVLELMSPAPTPRHQAITSEIRDRLSDRCRVDYFILLSPIDLILSYTEIRQPDLVMVHRDRINIITKRGIEGIPDLVVEVLSEHSIKRDRQHKLNTYARYEIPEYWIVDPAHEALEQYIWSDGIYQLHNVYVDEETVLSNRLPCVEFTMKTIMDEARDLPG